QISDAASNPAAVTLLGLNNFTRTNREKDSNCRGRAGNLVVTQRVCRPSGPSVPGVPSGEQRGNRPEYRAHRGTHRLRPGRRARNYYPSRGDPDPTGPRDQWERILDRRGGTGDL